MSSWKVKKQTKNNMLMKRLNTWKKINEQHEPNLGESISAWLEIPITDFLFESFSYKIFKLWN